MCLQDVMNLTRHREIKMNSAVFTGEYFGLSYDSFLSGFAAQYEALANIRVQSIGILKCNHIRESLLAVTDVLVKHILQEGKILVAGNGGSASQSQHFCAELMGRLKNKRSPIRAISLCSDISLLTCIANDFGYERIFSRQIEGLGDANDVFVAFTTSGKSRNIEEALLECKSQGITTIVFSGNNTNSLSRLADYIVDVGLEDSAVIQEAHMQLIHIMSEIIENIFKDWRSITID